MDKKQQGYKPKNGNDPAMPVAGVRESENSLKLYGQLFHGLTKREHFASALPDFEMTFPTAEEGAKFLGCEMPADDIGTIQLAIDIQAKLRVMRADALLKALDEN